MNSTLTISPVSKTATAVAKQLGHRIFTELDEFQRPIGYFAEMHESTTETVPVKTLIKRPRVHPTIPKTAILKSVPKKDRKPLNETSKVGRVALRAHRLLKATKASITRGELQAMVEKDLDLNETQAMSAVSDLIHRHNHLQVKS